MATKWSVPGVTFREIDNTVRANAEPGNGRGAIVLNSNKGLPNQRVLNTSLSDFYKMYGEPDNVNQYGHFAAANFFGAGSQQLLTVRATMGDEGYAAIQYPYTDAAPNDKKSIEQVQQFAFVDNNMMDNVVLTNTIEASEAAGLSSQGYAAYPKVGSYDAFEFSAKAERAILKDIFEQNAGNDSTNMYVYRADDASKTSAVSGKYFRFATTSGAGAKFVDLGVKEAALTAQVSATSYQKANMVVDDYCWFTTESAAGDAYWKTSLFIAANSAINGKKYWVNDFYVNSAQLYDTTKSAIKETVTINDLVNSANLKAYAGNVTGVEYQKEDVSFVKICDWDDMVIKSFTIPTGNNEGHDDYSVTHGDVKGVEYKEYGMAEYAYDLAYGDVSATNCSGFNTDDKYKELVAIAEEYGLETTELMNGKYAIMSYKPAKTYLSEEDFVTKIIKLDGPNEYGEDGHEATDDGKYTGTYEALFNVYKEYQGDKLIQKSVYKASNPRAVIKPWQLTDNTEEDKKVTKMVAMSTTEVMSDSTGVYAEGFTPSCDTDDEPGNGDIESYASNQENQLVIGAVSPGEWGNDIGITVITPEAAQYPCLSHANAFSWKYRYDDEDKVDGAEDPDDYSNNPENLTWKKVYRINVYAKPKDKTAKVWGFGLDALTAEPLESWYVSNDPTAKDGEGNTLYAPYVINGRSNYIYVSKKSVAAATNFKGEISMPMMTWSIYQLTGGENSKLNNVKEKTAALKLYADRQKADFDILFNVEGIDTFNGRQRYAAHQRRIAEIAANRGMDIGVIQTTSREAKTIRMELSEAKAFSFQNGSYVAAYAGYDRYYDSYTANWIYLPKSVAGACAMCYCDVYSYSWMAPAGLERGQIGYSNRSNIRLNDVEIGQLYDNNINTSKNCQGYGEVLWGQKTMLKKVSALSRINVRRLLNYIEKNLEVMLVPYLYQNNTVNTRTSMKTTVDSFLSRIQAAEGILRKSVTIATDPDDSHICFVNINIIPQETLEWVCVTLTVDRNNGVSTSEA